MKLALNYLSEVKELYDEGKINFVDYFKLYSISPELYDFEWCYKTKAVLFHGFDSNGSSIGNSDFFEKMDIEKVKKHFEKSKTPYISAHICVDYAQKNERNKIKNIMIENAKKTREIFGKELILENVPYRNYREEYKFISYPDFISDVIEKSGCGFLFDISHARSSADSLKIDFDKYVDMLPMHKVKEFHLAGTVKDENGEIRDKHGKLNEEDYIFLKQALNKYNTLETITLEYGSVSDTEKYNLHKVEFGKINNDAKNEVYEQLLRIKEIMNK